MWCWEDFRAEIKSYYNLHVYLCFQNFLGIWLKFWILSFYSFPHQRWLAGQSIKLIMTLLMQRPTFTASQALLTMSCRAIFPKSKEETSGSDMDQQNSGAQPPKPAAGNLVTGHEPPQSDTTKLVENRTGPSLAEEWEQLIVTELGSMPSPTCISTSKLDQPTTSPSQSSTRQLDERTSRILERLEVPRQLKRKTISPTFSCSFSADVCGPAKKPLIPYRSTDNEDQGPVASQPIKPNFQRLKRKK